MATEPATGTGRVAETVPPSRSFAPIEGPVARLLILGSLPGQASLEAQRYYAHPRNAFWPIALACIADVPLDHAAAASVPYADRVELLNCAGIAVWDVLGEARRPGSLDSAIVRRSERANDIAGFAARHPELERIAFNGRMAETLFSRHVELEPATDGRLARASLPSTSPAMAMLDLDAKHRLWRPVFC